MLNTIQISIKYMIGDYSSDSFGMSIQWKSTRSRGYQHLATMDSRAEAAGAKLLFANAKDLPPLHVKELDEMNRYSWT